MPRSLIFFTCCALGLSACVRPASERVELDERVGIADASALQVRVEEGLASVRELDANTLVLWAQAPSLSFELTSETPRASFRLDVHNCMPGAMLSDGTTSLAARPLPGRLAGCRFELALSGAQSFTLGPADAARREAFHFAVLSDIQRAIDRVEDIFERMNDDPELRFVVSTGDLANIGTRDELVRVQRELAGLSIPLFSTVGNHEMGAPPRHWHELFGRFNVHFAFKGVTFSLVDSGNATLDPEVYDWLDDWLDTARDDVHIALTHVPPLDPVGVRGGGFRSRKEAAKLLAKLGKGRVDALFLGHIHSYYAFSAAGVPIYLSGGGGAIEERLDGISRHYLKVRVTPDSRLEEVAVVRVD